MYNATVYRETSDDLQTVVSVFVAEVNDAGKMLRSNAVQCTGLEGSEEYDAYVRRNAFAGYSLKIVRDHTTGYREWLKTLRLPGVYVQ